MNNPTLFILVIAAWLGAVVATCNLPNEAKMSQIIKEQCQK